MTNDKKLIAVLLADVHLSIPTKQLAIASVEAGIELARKYNVSLIIAGDLHDSKANLRAECINAITSTLKKGQIAPYILVGNHCRVNEKSDEHALTFLEPYAHIVDKPQYLSHINTHLLPYYSDISKLKATLKILPKGSRLIMHQGCTGSNAGHYMQDVTALVRSDYKDFRVVSGHYHRRQDIKCGVIKENNVGLFSYIGNPYTLNFGEVNDPDKGCQLLYNDGSLEFIPLNLRKHVTIELEAGVNKLMHKSQSNDIITAGDLILVKLTGRRENVIKYARSDVAYFIKHTSFRLDVSSEENKFITALTTPNMTEQQLLDSIIDQSSNEDQNARVKDLWRKL